jgi:sugar phosphate permease
LVISVGTAGNIAAATPLVLMVQAMGWRMTFVVFAGINLLLALLCFTVVRDRPDATAAGPAVAQVSAKPRDIIAGVKALFVEKDYWIISLGTFCRYGIFAAVQALWAGPYLMELIRVSPVAAGNLLFLMSMGMIVGSPLCGWFSDSWIRSRKPVVMGGLVGMLIVLVILAGLGSGTGYLTLAVLFFGFGFFSGAGQIMYAHIKERMPIERAGTAMTGINFFTMTGAAVFMQGLGNMMERLYPGESLGPAAFRTSFLFCAGCLAVASLLYLMTRETLGRGASRR